MQNFQSSVEGYANTVNKIRSAGAAKSGAIAQADRNTVAAQVQNVVSKHGSAVSKYLSKNALIASGISQEKLEDAQKKVAAVQGLITTGSATAVPALMAGARLYKKARSARGTAEKISTDKPPATSESAANESLATADPVGDSGVSAGDTSLTQSQVAPESIDVPTDITPEGIPTKAVEVPEAPSSSIPSGSEIELRSLQEPASSGTDYSSSTALTDQRGSLFQRVKSSLREVQEGDPESLQLGEGRPVSIPKPQPQAPEATSTVSPEAPSSAGADVEMTGGRINAPKAPEFSDKISQNIKDAISTDLPEAQAAPEITAGAEAGEAGEVAAEAAAVTTEVTDTGLSALGILGGVLDFIPGLDVIGAGIGLGLAGYEAYEAFKGTPNRDKSFGASPPPATQQVQQANTQTATFRPTQIVHPVAPSISSQLL